MNHDEVENFLTGGCNLEAGVIEQGNNVREKSKLGYDVKWLDCRLMLLSSINYLITFRSGIAGNTNESNSHRLILLISLVQGAGYIESLISEGQYIKASACLKQDYEIITRINETKIGAAKPKVTPNVKHAPEGSQRFYGELNDISHPSNINILLNLVGKFENGEVRGVSPYPVYISDISRGLYQMHVWLLFEALREMIHLQLDLYGEEVRGELKMVKMHFVTVYELLTESGFAIVDDERI